MVQYELPLKDFLFVKKNYDNLDDYVVRTAYLPETVIISILDDKLDGFLLGYRSAVTRKGMANRESYNETGVRLNRIYYEYIVNKELMQE